MALQTKKLEKIGKTLFEKNTIQDGGLSSLVAPYTLTGPGIAVVGTGLLAFNLIKEGVGERNAHLLGKISYNAPARMTGSFTSGGIEAIERISKNNPKAFQEMASRSMVSSGITGQIDSYGATPELVSALYKMGGN